MHHNYSKCSISHTEIILVTIHSTLDLWMHSLSEILFLNLWNLLAAGLQVYLCYLKNVRFFFIRYRSENIRKLEKLSSSFVRCTCLLYSREIFLFKCRNSANATTATKNYAPHGNAICWWDERQHKEVLSEFSAWGRLLLDQGILRTR